MEQREKKWKVNDQENMKNKEMDIAHNEKIDNIVVCLV